MLSKLNTESLKVITCMYFVKSNLPRYAYENGHLILVIRICNIRSNFY